MIKSVKWMSCLGAMVALTTGVSSPTALPLPKLRCQYEGSYFKVSDGITEWQKYVGNWESKRVQIECGQKAAAALIGSYFVFFTNGVIQDHYVGSFDEDRRVLKLKGEFAAAVMGSYFVAQKADGNLVVKYIGSSDQKPELEVSRKLALATFGKTLAVTNGTAMESRYIGSVQRSQLVSRGEIGAAMMGPYFVAVQSYLSVAASSGTEIRWIETYVGSQEGFDTLVGSPEVIAASMSGYFVVFDPARFRVNTRYVGRPGRVVLSTKAVIFERSTGSALRYELESGLFR